jgi:hypothetical protein
MSQARISAIGRSTTIALRFDEGAGGITFRVFADGNHNGVRTADIRAGVDQPLEDPVLLGDLFPGVRIAVPAGVAGDAVQLSGGALLSFTPDGTATSGSIYIRGRDGSQFVVRVLGATGRSRVLRHDAARGEWIDALW